MKMDFEEIDLSKDERGIQPERRSRRKKKNSIVAMVLVLVFGLMTGSVVTSLISESKNKNKASDQENPEAVISQEGLEGDGTESAGAKEQEPHEITEEDIEGLRVEQEDFIGADYEEEDNSFDEPVEINWEDPVETDDNVENQSEPLKPGVMQENGQIDMTQLGIGNQNNSATESNYSDQEAMNGLEILKQSLMNGDGTVPALRKAFKNDVMVLSGGKFYFFPIEDRFAQHNYSNDNLFTDENGRLSYMLEDGTRAKRGVDVSKYQGAIEWDKVAADGIDYAFIRAGVRGYETGKLVMEEDFMTNATMASNQGIEIGVYFFSQAVSEEEAIEEADNVIAALGGNEIAYPVVYDIENVKGGRVGKLTKEQITDNCLAFCNRISEAGYKPMIYGNMESFLVMLDMERIEGIEKWFAYYTSEFYFPYDFRIWQYSDKGHVDGIQGNVDVNLCFY